MEIHLQITWFGFPFLLTRIAGSLTNADLFLLGERFWGGIWRVTPKVVCLPISSAKKLASRTKVLAFMMSCRSCARLRLNISSLPGYKRDVCSSMSSLEYNVKSQYAFLIYCSKGIKSESLSVITHALHLVL